MAAHSEPDGSRTLANQPSWFESLGLRLNKFFAQAPIISASVFIVSLVGLHGILAEAVAKSLDAALEYGVGASEFSKHEFLIIALSAMGFLFCTWRLWGLRGYLLRVSVSMSKSDGLHPHAALILGLSEPGHDAGTWDKKLAAAEKILKAADKPGLTGEQLLAPLRQTCAADGPCSDWNWQQPLRVILHDLEKTIAADSSQILEISVFVTESSQPHFKKFKSLLWPILRNWPGGAISMPEARLIDSTNVALCWHELRAEVKRLKSKYKGRRICLDATALQKPFSIAAALATLNSEMTFCYVIGDTPHFYDTNVSGVEIGGE